MDAFRLRIELPDRPGALAGVTGALADSGANIVSIDVHEVDGATAIDEITVQVPEDWRAGAVAGKLVATGAGTLLATRRLVSADEPLTAALTAIGDMVAGDARAVDDRCAEAISLLAHGGVARLVDVAEAVGDPAGGMAIERRSTIVQRTTLDGEEVWVLAALDDAADPHTVAFVTRSAEERFTATEVSRVDALLRIRRRLLIGRAGFAH